MKTELGNTTKSIGRDYSIAVTNYSGEDLYMSYDILQENTMIVSSKVDSNLEDTGTYALFITDPNGYPVRLTYTIQEGNGLHTDSNDSDIMRLVIDDESIMDENELYVNKYNIIDNDTLAVNASEDARRGRIGVVTANLEKASEARFGITKADEKTTYIPYRYYYYEDGNKIETPYSYMADEFEASGIISVNTQNLETVDDSYVNADGTTGRDGIVRHSSQMSYPTIIASDGKLSVNTQNLEKATNEKYGVVKVDDETIQVDDDGVISVITAGLNHATNYSYGTTKGDEITTTVSYGMITVNTRNLQPATATGLGVIMADSYSLTVDNTGLLSVNRFNEIEALLETNNPEHAIFRADIEDLKNRVSKLETSSQQELIEFLIPANDPETVLPVPIWDSKTKTTNHYSERKTISFSIKTNCKFNVNVEYKNNTNKYSQVTLISVKYGDNVNVPANQLANTVFDETGPTVKTLNFTFAVKNYDKDDNYASINTHVIFSAASINDAAIKQTSFHIFKCWNNLAFVEVDKPELPEPAKPILSPESYWIYTPGSESISIYGNTSKELTTTFNSTSTGNLYFNTYIVGTYMYYDPEQNKWNSTTNTVYTSASEDSTSDILTPVSIKCYKDENCTDASDDIVATISSTYNTTKQYNVLSVKTVKPLEDETRTRYIKVSVNNAETMSKIESSLPEIISIDGDKNKINDVYTAIHAMTVDDTINNSELPVIPNAVRNVTSNKTTRSVKVYGNILEKDLEAFDTAYANAEKYKEYANDKTDINYVEYKKAVDLMDVYATKISDEYSVFVDSHNAVTDIVNGNTNDSYVLFKYQEHVNIVQPIITINSVISGNTIKFNYARNAQSIVKNPDTLKVNVKYNFINKDGKLVNDDGSTQGVIDYGVDLYPKSAINYSKDETNVSIRQAASGVMESTTEVNTYYNVVAISGGVDGHSNTSWGIFGTSGKKDEGITYYGGWNPNSGTNITSKITDNIYGVCYFNGIDASPVNKRYWSIPLKGKANGEKQSIVKSNADNYKFMGLSTTDYASKGAKTDQSFQKLQIGNTVYITKKSVKSNYKNECTESSAAKEQTNLCGLAKQYYESNSKTLIRDVNKIPTKVANNIVGIKIKEVTVDSGSFYGVEPKITWSSSGSWNTTNNNSSSTSSGSGSSSSSVFVKNYTFGNAKISSIEIPTWDDYSMTISFTITGGSTTNIPINTSIKELQSTTSGFTNFMFVQDSKTYMAQEFYNIYECNCTQWIDNSCKVTYRLYNNYSLRQGGLYSTKVAFYNKNSGTIDNVYVDMVPPYLELYNTRNYDKYNVMPYLEYMTGIKFWIGVGSNELVLKENFESSKSMMNDTVPINARYNQYDVKPLNIYNSLSK